MRNAMTSTFATALLLGTVAVAHAQTAADGSTSPGGLVTSSQPGPGGYGYGFGYRYAYWPYPRIYAGPYAYGPRLYGRFGPRWY